jgi:hypothetical protein
VIRMCRQDISPHFIVNECKQPGLGHIRLQNGDFRTSAVYM